VHVDTWYVQGNILITEGGQACLADFGIAGALRSLSFDRYKLGSLRHMAPERFSGNISGDIDPLPILKGPSKESDIYSLAMTSFEVHFSAVNRHIA
jgi:serine/threonine protein kinase